VLPEGRLQSADLLKGARIALAALLAWTVFLVLVIDRPWMAPATLLALFLGWAYHRPPLHRSYRGHGEILQGIGCGVVLPLIGFYLQQGDLQGFPWLSLVPLYLLFHAGNIVTALPDYRSDRASNKRTYPVRHGERAARNAVMRLLFLACISLLVTFDTTSSAQGMLIIAPAAFLLIGLMASGVHQKAGVDDLAACRSFVGGVSISQAWLLCAWIAVLWTGNGQ
jgi:1,4-dihydroxy-2-naphthoate octaprenyltransferase